MRHSPKTPFSPKPQHFTPPDVESPQVRYPKASTCLYGPAYKRGFGFAEKSVGFTAPYILSPQQ